MGKVKFAQEKVRRGQGSPSELPPSRRKGVGKKTQEKSMERTKGRDTKTAEWGQLAPAPLGGYREHPTLPRSVPTADA